MENVKIKHLPTSYYEEVKLKYRSLLAAIAKNYDSILDALTLYDKQPVAMTAERNTVFMMVAFWVQLMTAQQVEALAKIPGFRLPVYCGSLTLMSVLERDDLKPEVLRLFV
jgi:hypothetical protein